MAGKERIKKTTYADTFTAPRHWGYEKWVENMDEYCGKVLHLTEGKKCSMHYHMKKLETMYLVSGRVLRKNLKK